MGFEVTFQYDAPADRTFTAPVVFSTALWPLFSIDAKLLSKLRLDSSFVKAYRTCQEAPDRVARARPAVVNNGLATTREHAELDFCDDDILIPCSAKDVAQWASTWLKLLEAASDAILTDLFLPFYGELKPGWLNTSKMTINPATLKWGVGSIKDGLTKLTAQAVEAAECDVGLVCQIREG